MSELVPAAIASRLESGRKASNLAFALRILPAERRRDALVFYRFCRTLDDIADSTELSDVEKSAALDAWRRTLEGSGQAPSDLEDIITRYEIKRSLLLEIFAGIQADLTTHRYATFEELRRYCWRVASAVGLVSIRIFGCTRPESEAYAESLGLALQWTNILRDVGEDAANGRIYLPQEDLARFGVAEADLLAGKMSPEFLKLMHFQAGRAADFFAGARHALPYEDRRTLLPAEIMREIYFRLLLRMRRDGFRVFKKRYRLGRLQKMWIIARAFISPARFA